MSRQDQAAFDWLAQQAGPLNVADVPLLLARYARETAQKCAEINLEGARISGETISAVSLRAAARAIMDIYGLTGAERGAKGEGG